MIGVTHLLLLVLFSGAVFAEQVYRWTDASGGVHYGARPGMAGAEKIEIGSKAKTADDAKSELLREERRARLLQSFEHDRKRKAREEENAAAQKRRQARYCKQLKQRWKTLTFPGALYYENTGNKRRFLSEEDREGEKDRLRVPLKKYCGAAPQG